MAMQLIKEEKVLRHLINLDENEDFDGLCLFLSECLGDQRMQNDVQVDDRLLRQGQGKAQLLHWLLENRRQARSQLSTLSGASQPQLKAVGRPPAGTEPEAELPSYLDAG